MYHSHFGGGGGGGEGGGGGGEGGGINIRVCQLWNANTLIMIGRRRYK